MGFDFRELFEVSLIVATGGADVSVERASPGEFLFWVKHRGCKAAIGHKAGQGFIVRYWYPSLNEVHGHHISDAAHELEHTKKLAKVAVDHATGFYEELREREMISEAMSK